MNEEEESIESEREREIKSRVGTRYESETHAWLGSSISSPLSLLSIPVLGLRSECDDAPAGSSLLPLIRRKGMIEFLAPLMESSTTSSLRSLCRVPVRLYVRF